MDISGFQGLYFLQLHFQYIAVKYMNLLVPFGYSSSRPSFEFFDSIIFIVFSED